MRHANKERDNVAESRPGSNIALAKSALPGPGVGNSRRPYVWRYINRGC